MILTRPKYAPAIKRSQCRRCVFEEWEETYCLAELLASDLLRVRNDRVTQMDDSLSSVENVTTSKVVSSDSRRRPCDDENGITKVAGAADRPGREDGEPYQVYERRYFEFPTRIAYKRGNDGAK